MSERQKINPISGLFTWLTGALSFLQLIDDVSKVRVIGLAREWVHAYASVVHAVSAFLFGWMHWRWFRIDNDEAHVLVLTSLLFAASARAHGRVVRRRWPDNRVRRSPTVERSRREQFVFGYSFNAARFSISLATAAVVPNATILLLVMFGVWLVWVFGNAHFGFDADVDEGYFLRVEIIGVLSTAAAIVLVSHILSR